MIPPSMREALIVSLLKPGKPPSECSSYRPLSLLNVDTKIFAKSLANRLAPLVPILVGPEQTGFVPGRTLSYNLRTVFGTIQHVKPDVKAAAVFQNAEKAFDSVEWAFMKGVLRRIGVGEVFLNLVSVLYNKPVARVRIEDVVTSPIGVSMGTRQGCPLSPLLYAIVAEPLLYALRDLNQ